MNETLAGPISRFKIIPLPHCPQQCWLISIPDPRALFLQGKGRQPAVGSPEMELDHQSEPCTPSLFIVRDISLSSRSLPAFLHTYLELRHSSVSCFDFLSLLLRSAVSLFLIRTHLAVDSILLHSQVSRG